MRAPAAPAAAPKHGAATRSGLSFAGTAGACATVALAVYAATAAAANAPFEAANEPDSAAATAPPPASAGSSATNVMPAHRRCGMVCVPT